MPDNDINLGDIANGQTAYGWGDHAGLYDDYDYWTVMDDGSSTETISSAGTIKFVGGTGIETEITQAVELTIKIADAYLTNIANGQTAFGWGDHAGLYSLVNHDHYQSGQYAGTPTGGVNGDIAFDDDTTGTFIKTNSAWKRLSIYHTHPYDNYSSWSIKDDVGNGDTISSGQSLNINGGTGINTYMDATREIAIEINAAYDVKIGHGESAFLWGDHAAAGYAADDHNHTGGHGSLLNADMVDGFHMDQDVLIGSTPEFGGIQFDLTYTPIGHNEGFLHWNDDEGTLELGMPGGEVILQIGHEALIRVTNKSGVDIKNGCLVYADGSQGNRLTVALADNTDSDKVHVLGMATEDIDDNSTGYISTFGKVRGSTLEPIDTSTFLEGDKLYLSTDGLWTNVHPPNSADAVIIVGRVSKVHTTMGVIEMTAAESFTLGNDFDGTLRQSVINKNTGTSAASGFTAVNNLGHFTTMGIAGSFNTTFPSEVSIYYAPGYGDRWQAVDGNKDFVWFTDPTDSHNNSALSYERMRLTGAGHLRLPVNGSNFSLGAANDLYMYHSTNSYITSTTGAFFLNSDAGNIKLSASLASVWLASAVNQDMYFDAGDEFLFRNRDSGNAIVTTIDSATGNINTIGNIDAVNMTVTDRFVSTSTDPDNSTPAIDTVYLNGYGLIGSRGNLYITNSVAAGNIILGINGAHNANPKLTIDSSTSTFNTSVHVKAPHIFLEIDDAVFSMGQTGDTLFSPTYFLFDGANSVFHSKVDNNTFDGDITADGDLAITGATILNLLTASRILELDASKNIISVAKATAYNKNFGGNGSATTISHSDHTHNYDNYSNWDLWIGGSYENSINSGQSIDFQEGSGIEITLGTSGADHKITFVNTSPNATHTGDVTGSSVLTIGANKVLDSHINWGTGATQVSTADIPEQTNLYYTEGRVTANANVSSNTAYQGIGHIPLSLKGANNGVAELDNSGLVPAAQLPAYVDDVLEFANLAAFPGTGETGKIYIALDTNLTYRWSGSIYVEISASLALGETSSTAYRGDRGKIAYDHSQSTHYSQWHADASAGSGASIGNGDTLSFVNGTSISIEVDDTSGNDVTITNTAPNVTTNLSTTYTATTATIVSSDGSNAVIAGAGITTAGVMTAADWGRLDNMDDNANEYIHPTHTAHNLDIATGTLSGNEVISALNIEVVNDTLGHITSLTLGANTRGLTLSDLGYTGHTDANKYIHPTHLTDDIDLDGAQVINMMDFVNGHVTSYSSRNLTLANLGYTGVTDADNYGNWSLYAQDVGFGSITSGYELNFRGGTGIDVTMVSVSAADADLEIINTSPNVVQTITLTGDVTGSGTGSFATTVGNDTHTHDTRYYTETELTNRSVSPKVNIVEAKEVILTDASGVGKYSIKYNATEDSLDTVKL